MIQNRRFDRDESEAQQREEKQIFLARYSDPT